MRYVGALLPSRARSILISHDLARHANNRSRLMVVKNARLAYAQVGHLFYPQPALEGAIDPSARVHPSATIGAGSRIEAGAIVAGAPKSARDATCPTTP